MIDSALIDTAIERMFSEIEFTAEPAGLYDPLRYMIEIGGKRIRPRLCLLAYSAIAPATSSLAPALDAACALEVFHTFTLLHDDIMDRSPLRRGQQTVWKKWSEDTAILSGDVMLIDAYKRIAKVPADKLDACLALFSETAAQVCEGQQFDMEFESVPGVSMADYEKMIGLKTAVLLACSAKMGALLAGASEKECDALYQYGYQLGMAFQVADDYLDAFGDEKVFGKPIGGDILNEKKSWLTVRACEKATAKADGASGTVAKAELMAAITAPAESQEQKQAKIAKVKGFYTALGVDEDARAEVRRYSSRAIDALEGLGLEKDAVAALAEFADSLVARAK